MTTNDALFNLRSCTENMQTALESSKRAVLALQGNPTLPHHSSPMQRLGEDADRRLQVHRKADDHPLKGFSAPRATNRGSHERRRQCGRSRAKFIQTHRHGGSGKRCYPSEYGG